MEIKKIQAKPISYSGARSLSSVKAIAIHGTAGTKDTAENNGNYYANGNRRKAGAHFFVDQNGKIVQSIDMDRIANAVGGAKWSTCKETGGGKYYLTYTNANTVSIELCAIAEKDPSGKMIQAVSELIDHIRKYCPNAKAIIRHFDVNGKPCPATMTTDTKWNWFLSKISNAKNNKNAEETKTIKSGAEKSAFDKGYTVKITTDVLRVRQTASSKSKITAKVKRNEVYTIVDESNGWGKLKSGAGWIYLKYTKRV